MLTDTSYKAFCNSVIQAALRFDRKPEDIRILAVSKSQSAEAIKSLYAIGQHAFGENYLQEALSKQAVLKDKLIEWHYIGRIQSNKTRLIAENFDWVQSLSDIRIAKRLHNQRPALLPPLNVLLQVNLQAVPHKFGLRNVDEILSFTEELKLLENLKFRGLMVMPEPAEEFTEQRVIFKQVKSLFDDLNRRGFQLDTLSMGTSYDYIAAIAEGSTLIRIGTALFGQRNYTKRIFR